jgi:hypothetical protein
MVVNMKQIYYKNLRISKVDLLITFLEVWTQQVF